MLLKSISGYSVELKDTHKENASLNKTETLTKSMNMDIWVVVSLNQRLMKGSYSKIKL